MQEKIKQIIRIRNLREKLNTMHASKINDIAKSDK